MKKWILFALAVFSVSCAIIVNAASVTATWSDNSTNEDGFAIEKSIDGAEFVEIARVEKDVTQFVDTGPFIGGTSYRYRLRAYNVAGFSDYSNTAEIVWPSLPNAPTAMILKIE